MQLWEIQYEVKIGLDWIADSTNVVSITAETAIDKCKRKELGRKYLLDGNKPGKATAFRLQSIKSLADVDIR